MQVLSIAGNVGKDAILRNTNSGDKVLGFSVAVSNGKDKDATWYDCSVWGKRAESLEPHIKKGSKLALSGRPTVRVHEGKAYLGLSVNELAFMGGGQARDEHDQRTDDDRGGGGGSPQYDLNDDIPFVRMAHDDER